MVLFCENITTEKELQQWIVTELLCALSDPGTYVHASANIGTHHRLATEGREQPSRSDLPVDWHVDSSAID